MLTTALTLASCGRSGGPALPSLVNAAHNASPGASVPVQFQYTVGQSSGPVCQGTIDMNLHGGPPSTATMGGSR